VGMLFIIGLFKNHKFHTNESDKTKWGIIVLAPWFTLLIGWFMHIIIQWQLTVN
jgi:hypothetical protein